MHSGECKVFPFYESSVEIKRGFSIPRGHFSCNAAVPRRDESTIERKKVQL